jgi:hypothetical protein
MAANWTAVTVLIPAGTVVNVTISPIIFEQNETSPGHVTTTRTPASPPVSMIVLRLFYSQLEQALFSLYLWANGLLSLLLNFLVLTIIGREPRLHTPENLIIASDAVNNVVLTLTADVYMLAITQLNSASPNYYLCQVSGYVSGTNFTMTSYLMMIYSYERYTFLCHPIAYAKRITKRRVVAAVVVALVISFVYLYALSYPDRVFSVTVVMAISRDVFKTLFTGLACVALPAVTTVVYSVVSIKRLQQR